MAQLNRCISKRKKTNLAKCLQKAIQEKQKSVKLGKDLGLGGVFGRRRRRRLGIVATGRLGARAASRRRSHDDGGLVIRARRTPEQVLLLFRQAHVLVQVGQHRPPETVLQRLVGMLGKLLLEKK